MGLVCFSAESLLPFHVYVRIIFFFLLAVRSLAILCPYFASTWAVRHLFRTPCDNVNTILNILQLFFFFGCCCYILVVYLGTQRSSKKIGIKSFYLPIIIHLSKNGEHEILVEQQQGNSERKCVLHGFLVISTEVLGTNIRLSIANKVQIKNINCKPFLIEQGQLSPNMGYWNARCIILKNGLNNIRHERVFQAP